MLPQVCEIKVPGFILFGNGHFSLYIYSLLSGCLSTYLTNFKKFRMQQQGLCVKLRNLTTSVLFLKALKAFFLALATSNTSHSSICFNSISGTAPQYLSDLLQSYTPTSQLRVCVCVCVCVCLCVISVTVKCPVLPPCVLDGRSRNPLYYYYYCIIGAIISCIFNLIQGHNGLILQIIQVAVCPFI